MRRLFSARSRKTIARRDSGTVPLPCSEQFFGRARVQREPEAPRVRPAAEGRRRRSSSLRDLYGCCLLFLLSFVSSTVPGKLCVLLVSAALCARACVLVIFVLLFIVFVVHNSRTPRWPEVLQRSRLVCFESHAEDIDTRRSGRQQRCISRARLRTDTGEFFFLFFAPSLRVHIVCTVCSSSSSERRRRRRRMREVVSRDSKVFSNVAFLFLFTNNGS